jgi:hypothetical protein
MKSNKLLAGVSALLAVLAMLVSITVTQARPAAEYSFKVFNNTNSTIKKLLASEDGSKYGYFDIGNGIGPKQTMSIVWNEATNGQSCHQYFKAVYDDGSESGATKFDFCESDLVLEFD